MKFNELEVFIKLNFYRIKFMIESGLDLRGYRRVLHYKRMLTEKKKLDRNHQDKKEETQIAINFLKKILIWKSVCFAVSLLVLFTEFCLQSMAYL